ncbi:MAG: hypothetical protein U1F51_05420 [Burkholderiales bacterium]
MNDAAAAVTIRYTRCPVPTATAVALANGAFDALYADGVYRFRDIAELGPAAADAHYTHAIDYFFRDGGGGPPVWARANGADSRLVGVTFMEELLGVWVRADDPAGSVADLAGRRIALPRWPGLVFDFWRFAAEKGVASALARHGLAGHDVERVDVIETAVGVVRASGDGGVREPGPGRPHGHQRQLEALVDGRVDAIFARGADAVRMERAAGGAVRLLYDLRDSPSLDDRVNNSSPRLVTVGAPLLRDHPEAVVRYLQGLLRASSWALAHVDQTARILARECGIDAADMARAFEPGFAKRLAPTLARDAVDTVRTMKAFLVGRGIVRRDFDLDRWVDGGPLDEALARERQSASA